MPSGTNHWPQALRRSLGRAILASARHGELGESSAGSTSEGRMGSWMATTGNVSRRERSGPSRGATVGASSRKLRSRSVFIAVFLLHTCTQSVSPCPVCSRCVQPRIRVQLHTRFPHSLPACVQLHAKNHSESAGWGPVIVVTVTGHCVYYCALPLLRVLSVPLFRPFRVQWWVTVTTVTTVTAGRVIAIRATSVSGGYRPIMSLALRCCLRSETPALFRGLRRSTIARFPERRRARRY
jgi:hypothetical protein